MIQCKKLMSLGLSERREVLEKSGLCTFCLKHAAELECYGRGGMSKPRCTQPGCDGEHTLSVHRLMGEENVGVNLVAEHESEDEDEDEDEGEDEDEDEGWWVGTVGVMEEPEYTADDCCADEVSEDGWWNPGSTQPYSVGGGTEIQHPPAEQLSFNESTTAPDGPPMVRSSRFTGTKLRKLRKKPRTTMDQDWEEARQDAWLRQMLSDTSSDEEEERYGRFAESGRWMSELFKIPQHLAATSGGECSGQKKPE
jgi:hypothetical protein